MTDTGAGAPGAIDGGQDHGAIHERRSDQRGSGRSGSSSSSGGHRDRDGNLNDLSVDRQGHGSSAIVRNRPQVTSDTARAFDLEDHLLGRGQGQGGDGVGDQGQDRLNHANRSRIDGGRLAAGGAATGVVTHFVDGDRDRVGAGNSADHLDRGSSLGSDDGAAAGDAPQDAVAGPTRGDGVGVGRVAAHVGRSGDQAVRGLADGFGRQGAIHVAALAVQFDQAAMVGGSIDVTGRVAVAPVALAGDVSTPSQNHRGGGGVEGDPHPGGRRRGVQVAQIAIGVVDVLQLGDRAVVDGKQPLCSRQGIEASGGLRNASDEPGGGRWRDGEGVGWAKRSRKIPERIHQLIDALVMGDVVDGVF